MDVEAYQQVPECSCFYRKRVDQMTPIVTSDDEIIRYWRDYCGEIIVSASTRTKHASFPGSSRLVSATILRELAFAYNQAADFLDYHGVYSA